MANNNDSLRNLVRKRRAAVTAKERRILNNTGIDIKGTKEDPRRPVGVIKKYNKVQLQQYLNKLDAFMSRSNGYVPDASGGFIRKSQWLDYKRTERKYNKLVKEHFNEVADIHDPQRNMTVREAEALYIPDSKRAQGEIRHRPFSEVNRISKNIKSAEALKKLQMQVEGKLDKGYLPKAIAAGRDQAGKMLDNAGLSAMRAKLTALTNKQFNILWNYWGFATRLAQIGDSDPRVSGNVEDKSDRISAQDKSGIEKDVDSFLDQALKLFTTEIKFNRKKKK